LLRDVLKTTAPATSAPAAASAARPDERARERVPEDELMDGEPFDIF
jgi:hypothetical protein